METLCQRPERASFISTYTLDGIAGVKIVCQRPERASFISTRCDYILYYRMVCVNALNGLPSFLRYPPRARINTGFAGSFLQVFV